MNEEQAGTEPTLVEKWIRDQQEWQKMAREYFDSMVKNDEFLVHLGNAMRGSLLAGKPYPGTERPEEKDEAAAADDRIDEILHALHQLQGDVADLKMAVEDLAARKVNVQEKPRVVAAAQTPAQVTSSRPAVTPAPPEENTEPPRDSMPPDPAPMDLNQGEG